MHALFLAILMLAPQDITCPTPPGGLAGPFVRDSDTAVAIFQAVTDPLAGGEDFSGYQVKAEETREGRAWLVFHVTGMRGGGVAMVIDKCTGAISEVQYQR